MRNHTRTVPLRKKHRRRRVHFITDLRHFAGVKAARTRRINETVERIMDGLDGIDLPFHGAERPAADRAMLRAILEDVL